MILATFLEKFDLSSDAPVGTTERNLTKRLSLLAPIVSPRSVGRVARRHRRVAWATQRRLAERALTAARATAADLLTSPRCPPSTQVPQKVRQTGVPGGGGFRSSAGWLASS